MRSPIYALIWEQWRQVRTPVIFAIALTVLASWTLHFTMELSLQSQSNKVWTQTESEDWGTASMALAAICMILVMSALAFTHSNTRDLRMGLPARLLTLPVSQFRLASTQIAFRIFAVVLAALIICALLALIDPWYAQMVLPFAGISLLGYSYVTLVATTIGKRTPVIASVVILLTITPVIVSLFAMEDALANQPAHFIAVKPGYTAPQHNRSMVVFGAFFITCVGVSVYRFATIRNAAPIQIMMLRGQSPAAPQKCHFDYAVHDKFEWRRLGWLYPSFAVGILVVYLLPLNLLARVVFSEDLFFAALITTPPLAGFIVGMILIAREHRDSVTGVARFMWTRPVTVQDVVLSRMKALGVSILYTYLLLGAVALLAALFSGVSLNVRILEFLFCLGSFFAVIIGVWSLVWVPFVPVLLWIVGVTCIAISTMMNWTMMGDFSFWIVDLVFWFILFFLARACARRQLFERRVVLRFVVFCAALAAVAHSVYFVWLEDYYRTASMSPLFVPAAITVSALPLFALLWQGFFLDRVRHNALFRRLPARDS